MVKSLVVVVVVLVNHPYSTKHLSATASKTSDPTVESRSSDRLPTPTALANHPDIPELDF